jgi:hypothetical protein
VADKAGSAANDESRMRRLMAGKRFIGSIRASFELGFKRPPATQSAFYVTLAEIRCAPALLSRHYLFVQFDTT